MECSHKNNFCFVCGEAVIPHSEKRSLLNNVKLQTYYRLYFKKPYVGGLWYTPDYCCATCTRTFYGWVAANEERIKEGKEKRKIFAFKVPMIWLEPPSHDPEMCFFCQTSRVGFRSPTRSKIKYKYNEFTVPVVPRSATEKVPKFHKEKRREDGEVVSDSDSGEGHESGGVHDDGGANVQEEIYEDVHIIDEIDELHPEFVRPEDIAGPSGVESRHTTATSIASTAESTVSNTYPPAKREKLRHFLTAADINDIGKNAE